MSKTLSLVSASKLSKDEIGCFVLRLGGELTEDVFLGRISRGEGNLWIGLSAEELDCLRQDDIAKFSLITEILGDEPQTYIVLQVGRGNGSEQIMLDFAFMFGQTFPFLLGTPNGELLNFREVSRRRDIEKTHNNPQ